MGRFASRRAALLEELDELLVLGALRDSDGLLAINIGKGSLGLTNAETINATSLTLGAITRSLGGTVNVNLPTGGSVNVSGADGLIGGWATVNGNTFATLSSGVLTGLSAGSYVTDAWTTGANVDATVASQPTAGSTINAFRVNAPAVVTLSGLNTITSGGILVGNGLGSGLAALNGGQLTAGVAGAANELIVSQQNTGSVFSLGSALVDNAGGVTSLTKSGDGTVALTGISSLSGVLRVNSGTLQLDSSKISTSLAGANLYSSNLVNAAATINVAQGATLAVVRADGLVRLQNAVTGSGTIVLDPHTAAGTSGLDSSNWILAGTLANFTGSLVNIAGSEMKSVSLLISASSLAMMAGRASSRFFSVKLRPSAAFFTSARKFTWDDPDFVGISSAKAPRCAA